MNLDSILSDPTVGLTLGSILDACRLGQLNAEESLDPKHGATRGVFGYVGHFYRKYEVEKLDVGSIPGFQTCESEQRIEVCRDDLRIMVVGLGKRPSQDPLSWMPQNQDGWPPTEHRQRDLLSADGVPLRGHVVFVCCILDDEGYLESVELRRPRIDEHGFLFAWSEIRELWAIDEEKTDHTDGEDETVEVEVRRGRKRPSRDEPAKKAD